MTDGDSIFACNEAEDLKVTKFKLMVSGDEVWAIDNIYKDPDAVREHALKSDFSGNYNSFHPGICSPAAQHSLPVTKAMRKLIFKHHTLTTGSFFAKLGGTGQWDDRKSVPHTDNAADFAGVVCLTPEPEPGDGTSFFRHKKLRIWKYNFGHVPTSMQMALHHGFESVDIMHRYLRSPKAIDHWEEVLSVPAKYNRLIFYSSDYFHSASHRGCSEYDLETNPRLTQNFFFTVKKPVHPLVQGDHNLAF